jgi:hypothetical protein
MKASPDVVYLIAKTLTGQGGMSRPKGERRNPGAFLRALATILRTSVVNGSGTEASELVSAKAGEG